MENMTQTKETQEISKEEVLDILMNIMPREESTVILNTVSLPDIQRIFNDPECRKTVIRNVQDGIMESENFLLGLKRIPALIQKKDELLQKHAVDYYTNLSREQKKDFCNEMMNQRDFQRDMCETIFDELEKQIPSTKPLMDALNVRNNFLGLYDKGAYHSSN